MDTPALNKIEPCPYCTLYNTRHPDNPVPFDGPYLSYFENFRGWMISCYCNAQGPIMGTQEEAIKVWNSVAKMVLTAEEITLILEALRGHYKPTYDKVQDLITKLAGPPATLQDHQRRY